MPDGDRRPRGWAKDLVQRLAFLLAFRPFLRMFVGLRVIGRENLPASDPFVLVANHSSHLDTVSLLGLLPGRRLRRVRPVAAADYFERNRAIAWLTRTLFNTLPIARRDFTAQNDPRAAMLAAIERGDSLIVFPEGTRGTGRDVGRFKSGVGFLAARRPDVPFVPAYLENMGRSLPKGEFLPVPFFCEIRIGPPIRPSGDDRAIADTLHAAVEALRDAR